MKVSIIGYKSTDHYIEEILEGLEFEDKIGLQSPRGKLLRHLAKVHLRDKNKTISTYKRLYCLIGEDVSGKIQDAEERFLKTLTGKPVSDIVVEFDIEILEMIDLILEQEGSHRMTDPNIFKIRSEIKRLSEGFEKDLKKYEKFKNDSLYSFRIAEYSTQRLNPLIREFRNSISDYEEFDKMREKIEEIARMKKWI